MRSEDLTAPVPAPAAQDPGSSLSTEANLRPQSLLSEGEVTGYLSGGPAPLKETLSAGTRVGRYVVLEKVGEGGMGVVYAAHDSELQRKVAIKLLHGGRSESAGEARLRLLREAQVLAQLSHPNVIAVHDVGTFQDAVFMAMEFVEGQSLRQWLRAAPRSWREVLDVFLAAGEGLLAAHDKGLVHRDFKPDNVLISKSGRIYVLDFGLARPVALLSPDSAAPSPPTLPSSAPSDLLSSSASSPLTQAGNVMGTLPYLAPELLKGHPADARSDAFAFAISLFEGLYGRRPFAELGRWEVQTVPKAKLAPGWVHRAVLAGLRPEAKDRPDGLRALLTELRKDPAPVRRQRALLFGALALAGLAAFAVDRAGRQRSQLCKGEEARLAGVWDAPVQARVESALLHTGASYAAQTWQHLKPVLDGYAGAILQQRTEACLDTRVRGSQSDEVLSLRMACLDQRLTSLRALTDVLAQADTDVVRQSIKAASSLPSLEGCSNLEALRAPAKVPGDRAVQAKVLAVRAKLARVSALTGAYRFAPALAAAQEALDEARPLHYRPLEAEALFALGLIQGRMEKWKESAVTLRAALAAAEAGSEREVLVQAAIRLVSAADNQGQFEDAQAWAAFARGGLESLGGSRSLNALLVSAESGMLIDMGRLREAAAELQAFVKEAPGAGMDPVRLAGGYNNLGSTYMNMRKPRESQLAYEKALALLDQIYGPDHPERVAPMMNLAEIYRELEGPSAKTEEALVRAIELSTRTRGPESTPTVAGRGNLGLLYAARGEYARAIRELSASVDLSVKARGPKAAQLSEYVRSLADAQLAAGHVAEAEQGYLRAAKIDEAQGVHGGSLALALEGLAVTQQLRGRMSEALRQHERAWAMVSKDSSESPEAALVLRGMGEWSLRVGKASEAVAQLTRALATEQKALGETDPDLGLFKLRLGQAQLAAGSAASARATLEDALQRMSTLSLAPGLQAETRLALARALKASGAPRARSEALARLARENYLHSEDGGAEQVREVDHFLAGLHR